MSLINATQQLWLNQLRDQRSPKIFGIRDWIASGNYRIEDIPLKKNTKLVVDSSTDIIEALAYDILRFSCAAFESVQRIEMLPDRPKANGWIIIRAYYAAYFSANTLMRLFGYFCVNIDQFHVSSIHEMANLYEVSLPSKSTARLSAGTYVGRYTSDSNSGLVVIRSLQGIGGGAHKQFWASFKEFLENLADDLKGCALSKSAITEARNSIKLLLQILCGENHQNGNWLSEVRNAVNYRLEHGAWHPYDSSEINSDALISLINESFSKPDFNLPSATQIELVRAVETCAYLVSWMRLSLLGITNQSKGGSRYFLRTGPLSLL